MPTVYLIHLDEKLGNPDNPRAMAQHYIGWAIKLDDRVAMHRAGTGSRILAAANRRGIGWRVAQTWDVKTNREARALETNLKARKQSAGFCPICREENANMACVVHGSLYKLSVEANRPCCKVDQSLTARRKRQGFLTITHAGTRNTVEQRYPDEVEAWLRAQRLVRM